MINSNIIITDSIQIDTIFEQIINRYAKEMTEEIDREIMRDLGFK